MWGGLFEQIAQTGAATKYLHYIFAGGARVALHTSDDAPSPTSSLRYLHQDHLGSLDTVTDETGQVIERLSYDAFGKRRTAEGEDAWADAALAIAAAETARGFTDHEHLDDFQLVHMNGRVYDPLLGRFLSADPFVRLPAVRSANPFIGLARSGGVRPSAAQPATHAASAPFSRPASATGGRVFEPAPLHGASPALGAAASAPQGRQFHDPVPGRRLANPFIRLPANTQGLNRYAYVTNNPLSFIDPSGYDPEDLDDFYEDVRDHLDGYTDEAVDRREQTDSGVSAYSAGLTDTQVANIVVGEMASLYGDETKLNKAYSAMVHAVLNGDELLGSKRPKTASDTLNRPLSPGEQSMWNNVRDHIVLGVRDLRKRDIDPTNGAVHFNFRDATRFSQGAQGVASAFHSEIGRFPSQSFGPFYNSAPSPFLGPQGIFLVIY